MKRKITAGTTSLILPLFIADTSSTVGAGLTGLAFNSAGLAAKYKRLGQSTWTTITLATMTAGTYTSGGFVESDSGAGGSYEFCPPDAAIAAGATAVVIEVYGATNMLAIRIEIELDAATYQTTWSTFNAASQTVDVGAVEGTDATDYFDAMVAATRSGLATSAKQDTAQADLDILTGDDGALLDSATTDVYHAEIDVRVDEANSQDEYSLFWFKNGVRITSGITSPTLQVVKRSDGTDLIASTTPSQIGSTGIYKHDATTTARLTAGEAAVAIVTATIDAGPRTFAAIVGRDSSA